MNKLSRHFLTINNPVSERDIESKLITGDFFAVADKLPESFVDLLLLDPPYNLSKNYNGNLFRRKERDEYSAWFEQVIKCLNPLLKPTATIYVCSDWQTSTIIYPILAAEFYVQNRITWEREKGRGAKRNWKNNTEDIWFCTRSKKYFFNTEAVKLKRKVIAPYREEGTPKDWTEGAEGRYRLTYPSNIWTDVTVPFWSMPENTDHPTQKPEKLVAKLILASSKPNDFVFDPFLGSGTSAVVASKLGRRWSGIELNNEYLCWAQKRILQVKHNPNIQGYEERIFWERNSLSVRGKRKKYQEIPGLL